MAPAQQQKVHSLCIYNGQVSKNAFDLSICPIPKNCEHHIVIKIWVKKTGFTRTSFCSVLYSTVISFLLLLLHIVSPSPILFLLLLQFLVSTSEEQSAPEQPISLVTQILTRLVHHPFWWYCGGETKNIKLSREIHWRANCLKLTVQL